MFTGTNSTITGASTAWTDSVVMTAAGNQLAIRRNEDKSIHPKLYFKFVKSKLKISDTKTLRARMLKLKVLAEKAWQTGQTGLAEQFEESLVVMLREQEILAAGYGKFVTAEDINRFISMVRGYTVKQCDLKNFPRLIPEKAQKKLQGVRKLNIFDSFWVVYNDPIDGKPLKTTKDKIKEKDPILFGRLAFDSNRYFYITDWVDEYCDLTMDVFIQKFSADIQAEYALDRIEEPSEKSLKAIREAVEKRHAALKATNRSNWVAVAEAQSEGSPHQKKSWLSRILHFFFRL